jgi:hypothetical protein
LVWSPKKVFALVPPLLYAVPVGITRRNPRSLIVFGFWDKPGMTGTKIFSPSKKILAVVV